MTTPVAMQSATAQAPVAARMDVGQTQSSPVPVETQQVPIPYRSESGGAIATTGGALAFTGLLLALLVVGLRFAKKKGLLDRWIVALPARAIGGSVMRVERALRVSPRTTIYRIHDAGRHYLLVESLANAKLVPLNDDDSHPETDEHDQDTR